MRFTTQMRAEIETIQKLIHHINKEFLGPMIMSAMRRGGPKTISMEEKENFRALYEELNSYKVRLENILCETDKKEQGHLYSRHLVELF